MQKPPITTQPTLPQLLQHLAAQHGVDLAQPEVTLTLTQPDLTDALLLYHAGTAYVVLACLVLQADGQLLPEVEFLFDTRDPDWKIEEIRYSPAAWATFLATTATQQRWAEQPAAGMALLNHFIAHWANRLVGEGWLSAGQACVRLPGCQSANHTACYGTLWQCSSCSRFFCCAEGTDDHPALCDDCWAARFAPTMTMGESLISFTAAGSLTLACDCPEQCGAWLELSADGVLALEDKDGQRVSLQLPTWLDRALRRAATQGAKATTQNWIDREKA